jgi:uncharacterized protein
MKIVSTMDWTDSQARAAGITVRRMDFEFGDDIAKFWFDNNPFLTALLDAMSVGFPPGERFFIDSVRHYEVEVTDPVLKERIRGFIGQEANHTKEHLALNQFLEARGYPADKMTEFATRGIQGLQKISSPAGNLARTAALEHFTAILASALIEHPEVFERMDPTLAQLWAWHAIEEIEHRSVAFDVYQVAVKREFLRLRAMVFTTLLFLVVVTIRTTMLLSKSGNLFNVRAWISGMNLLWGRPGVFRKLLPNYLAYYRKRFHPDQHDNHATLEQARQRWLVEAV